MNMRNGLVLACLLLGGCQQHYYKITDIATGKEFYTKSSINDLHRVRGGGIHFTDVRNGDHVELQSSQIREVSEQEAIAAPKR